MRAYLMADAAFDSFSVPAAAAADCDSVLPLLLFILCLSSALLYVLHVWAFRLTSIAC
jgi:hypothetical protein